MTADTNTPVRRSRRRTAAPGAADLPTGNSLDSKLARLYALKVASDEAKAAYEDGKKDFQNDLARYGKDEHIIPANSDRPSVKAGLATRTTTTIDPVKYRAKVDDDEFMASVSIKIKDAEQYLGKAQMEKVSTKVTSAPFVEVRTLGASRKK